MFPLGSADPFKQSPGLQDSTIAAVVPLCGDGLSSSSSQSSINDQGPRPIQQQEHSCDGQYRKHLRELIRAHRCAGIHKEGSRTLEFFIDPPAEPTFSQERNNLHAKEVSSLMTTTAVSDRLRLDLSIQQTYCKTCFSLNLIG